MCEGLWLQKLLEELSITIELPIKLYCDNKAAISISQNPIQHDRTKHIEVDRHFIKEKNRERDYLYDLYPYRGTIDRYFHQGVTEIKL